ncbi:isochorismatase family protein [Peptoanaerobacter stomatis]|uniref:isochorismatase family protein n=1 Tax=Peptoanaerobacter stomatis TaxID=796937 RepID=UPI003FA1578B
MYDKDITEKYRLTRDNCLVLVIDLQGKLLKAMFNEEDLKLNGKRLVEFADIFSIPVIFTEQNPKALGPTSEDVLSASNNHDIIPKVQFSAFIPELKELLKKHKRTHIIMLGVETHVCVYQTARDLISNGYEVTLISDCVGSRTEKNYLNGIDMMQKMGAVISNTETVLFDVLHTSADPDFKKVQALIK